ncbi:MAG: beta-lactamase family protein [Acidimicrobiia bacterium]|nr:beta-lactamase family protein [Acidimicrobiia bacterium]
MVRLLLLLAFLASPSPAQHQERIRRIENGLLPSVVPKAELGKTHTLAGRMREHKVPAVSVAVIDNFELAWSKAWGHIEEGGAAATAGTLFQAGSVSKPVAATVALKLVETGKLSLDDDVNLRLRSWKLPGTEHTEKEKVTLRRLLSHNAGLTVHGFPGYAAGTPLPTTVQVLDGAPPANTSPVRADMRPGSKWRYSGGGYTVAQLLMADVSGKPFEDLAHELVLKPIGMSTSTYRQPLPPDWAARAATGHLPDGRKVVGRFHTYPEMAAAGLWTTAADLARWAIEIPKSLAGRSNRVLSRETTTEMLTAQAHHEGGAHGLGPALGIRAGNVIFSHGGRDQGFDALLIANAQTGQGAAILINANNNRGFITELLRAIAAEYRWRGAPPPQREQ